MVFENLSNRGSVLLMFYLVLTIFIIVGATLLMRVLGHKLIVSQELGYENSFLIADSGFQRAVYDLRQDMFNDPTSPAWDDGDINGMSVGPSSTYAALPYASTNYLDGSYQVSVKNISGDSNRIWIRSVGTFQGQSKTIEAILQSREVSIWDNAIFAGSGVSGGNGAVNGNVNVGGSITVLGTDLSSSDYAIDLNGSSKIALNYCQGISAAIQLLIPTLEQVDFNGEIIGSLNSTLRVKNGQVGLTGSATVGIPDLPLNLVKETADGVYVSDGFGGSQGAANVYSDNGTSASYDLGDLVSFPDVSDTYEGFSDYETYLKSVGYTLSAAEATALSSVNPTSSFSYGDANGQIAMNGLGGMTVDGVVVLENGGDLSLDKQGFLKTITYSGTGVLYVSGDVSIHTDLLTSGLNSFPSNMLGIITPNSITFDEANITAMGLFFADDEIVFQETVEIIGSLVSNHINASSNIPELCHVPSLVDNLPDHIIGLDPQQWVQVDAWLDDRFLP